MFKNKYYWLFSLLLLLILELSDTVISLRTATQEKIEKKKKEGLRASHLPQVENSPFSRGFSLLRQSSGISVSLTALNIPLNKQHTKHLAIWSCVDILSSLPDSLSLVSTHPATGPGISSWDVEKPRKERWEAPNPRPGTAGVHR